MKSQQRSLLYALMAVLAWSTVATAFKLALEEIAPIQLIFVASTTSAFLLLSIIYFRSGKKRFLPFSLSSFVMGLLNPILYYLVLFFAYDNLPAKIAQPINYSWPLFFVLFLMVFRKEEVKVFSFIGLLISLAGLIMIVNENYQNRAEWNSVGVLLAFLSAFIWAIYWLLRLKVKGSDSRSLFWGFLAGSVVSGIYLVFRQGGFDMSMNGILFGVYVGIFEMGITFLFWQKALKITSNRAFTSNLIYLSPIISLFIINQGLGEKITLGILAGLLLILSGIFIQRLKI